MIAIPLSNPQAVMRVHDLPGSGRPLVFLHGLGCASSCDYPRVVRDGALSSRHVVLVDLLGSGFSDRPLHFDYSIQLHARVVASTLDALGISSLDLFGHSMGGAVAIEAASMLGDRVAHLVLSEPNLDAGGGVFSRAIASHTEADYLARGHAQVVQDATAAGNHIWAGSLAVTAPHAAYRTAASLVRGGSPSWREQLFQHPSARTVLFGALSLPDPDTARLPRSGVSVAIVAGAGHSMAWENPSGLAAAIAEACATPVPASRGPGAA